MARIYTKTGDHGETSLFGGERVRKDHLRLDAYGTLDELNAILGWFVSRTDQDDLAAVVKSVQPVLFDIGAHLATASEAKKARANLPPLSPESVEDLEHTIDRLEKELEPLTSFILPGGAETSAILHVARAVCRRAEREVVRAGDEAPLEPPGLPYLNRLSDLLFVMARVVNRRSGITEPVWKPGAPAE